MIRIKDAGSGDAKVLDGTIGMTVSVESKDDYWMDGGYAGYHYEACYIDYGSPNVIRGIAIDRFDDATVDCSVDTYRDWLERVRKPHLIESMLSQHHRDCMSVRKGREVIVMRGRKVPIGTKGIVFWEGASNYDPYGRWWNEVKRIGIRDASGNVHFTSACNADVVDPTLYYDDSEVIESVEIQIRKELERYEREREKK